MNAICVRLGSARLWVIYGLIHSPKSHRRTDPQRQARGRFDARRARRGLRCRSANRATDRAHRNRQSSLADGARRCAEYPDRDPAERRSIDQRRMIRSMPRQPSATDPATNSAPSARRSVQAGEPCHHCGAAPCPAELPTGLEPVHVYDADGRYLGRAVAVVAGHLAPHGHDARRWRSILERDLMAWTVQRQLGSMRRRLGEIRADVPRPFLEIIDGGTTDG